MVTIATEFQIKSGMAYVQVLKGTRYFELFGFFVSS